MQTPLTESFVLIFPPDPEIGDFDGFTRENDLFERKSIGDGLSHLISVADQPLVIALDAQWGAGKTVFLKQWAGELRKAGYPVVFFDAFKNDYVEDAFAALAGEIIGLVQARKKALTPKGKKLISGAKDVTRIVSRAALRATVKIATASLIDTKDLEEAGKTIGEELSELEDRYLGELLTKQKDTTATIESFRIALAELPSLLSEAVDAGGTARPLIFIVDEMDRCRPKFALELLERMKHFFSVPNVHFVLGAHLGQLKNSVAAAYGSQMDASLYLQKFIHLTVHLGEGGQHDHQRVGTRYLRHLESIVSGATHRDALSFVRDLANKRHFSLRTIQRITSCISISYAFVPQHWFSPPPLIAGLCVLKVVDNGMYVRAMRGILTWDAVSQVLGLPVDRPKSSSYAWDIWAYCTNGPLVPEDRQRIFNSLGRFSFDGETNLLAWLATNVTERLAPIKG